MGVTYGFYNAINGDRKYNALQMSSLFDGIIRDGVFLSIGDGLIISAETGMTVSVGIGRAWFNHTWTKNDAPYLLTVEQSEVILNRIDMVVLEINSTDDVRANIIKIVKGTPSSNPVAPALIKSELVNQYPLAIIYIKPGVTEITAADITNKVGTSECPFVTGILETLNIDLLLQQWDGEFNSFLDTSTDEFNVWFESVKGALDGDIAGNLLNRIIQLEEYGGVYASDTPPEGIKEDRLWLDTGDNEYQGTALERFNNTLNEFDTTLTEHLTKNASTTEKGHSQLATIGETIAGTDDTKTITPSKLEAKIVDYGQCVTESVSITPTVARHRNKIASMINNSAVTITIPTYATAAFPNGTQITFIMHGPGAVTFAPASGVTLCSKDTKRTIDGQYGTATLIKYTDTVWWLIGALK
jgi:hypothetical protein